MEGRKFKPLFLGSEEIHTKEEVKVYDNSEELLREELESLLGKLEEKEKEVQKLKKEIEELTQKIREKDDALNQLSEKLKNLEVKNILLDGIEKGIKEEVSKLVEYVSEELESYIRKVLEEFSLNLPQEEILKKQLREILYELVNLREKIKLYLNPEDYRIIAGELKLIKEDLKEENMELEVVIDENLSRGEFLIKGEHFRIERSPEDFAKEVYKCVLRNGTQRD